MKKLLGLVLLAFIATSCSTIEDATSKWKTPEEPNAGLSEGEKSNYLDTTPTATPAAENSMKAEPKKKKKKAKK